MNSGRLRYRIAIQAKTETRDSRGGVIETWATEATRWGNIEPLSMREQDSAQQLDARLSHRVTLRYFAGLSTKHRLVYESRVFHVESVRNIGERDRQTEALCMEQEA